MKITSTTITLLISFISLIKSEESREQIFKQKVGEPVSKEIRIDIEKILQNNVISNQNMTVTYETILNYIQRYSKKREKDYFFCAMRLILSNPFSQISDSFLRNLMFAKNKKFNNGNYNLLEFCEPDDLFEMQVMENFGEKIDFEEIFEGKNNYYLVSKIVNYLQETNISPPHHAFVLNVLNNVFDIKVDSKFKKALELKNAYVKFFENEIFDLNVRQLIRNLLAECSIKQKIKEKFQFWFDDIKLESVNDEVLNGLEHEKVNILDIEEVNLTQKDRDNSEIMNSSYWHFFYPENNVKTNICFECENWLKLAAKDTMELYRLIGDYRLLRPKDTLIDVKAEKLRESNKKRGNKGKSKDYLSERMMIVTQMAERGNVHAINEIAQNQYFGNIDQGIQPNRELAFENYQRAARMGDVNAEANIGILKFQSNFFS